LTRSGPRGTAFTISFPKYRSRKKKEAK
jgi:hypothetical protein